MAFYCLSWQTCLSQTSLQPLHIIACCYKMDCNHGNLLFVVTDQLAADAYHCLLLQNGLQSWHFIACCYKMACSHDILLLVVTKWPAVMAFYCLLLQNGLKSWHFIACCYKMAWSHGILLLVVTKWPAVKAFYCLFWQNTLQSVRVIADCDQLDLTTKYEPQSQHFSAVTPESAIIACCCLSWHKRLSYCLLLQKGLQSWHVDTHFLTEQTAVIACICLSEWISVMAFYRLLCTQATTSSPTSHRDSKWPPPVDSEIKLFRPGSLF